MRAWEIMVAATVTLVAIYLFVYKADGTSKIINEGSTGWARIITAFQGR